MKNYAMAVKLARLMLFVVLTGILLVLGFYLMLVAAFSGSTFYNVLCWLAYPVGAVSILVFIFAPASRRYAKRFYIILFLCVVVPVVSRSTYLHFDGKVPVLYDGVNIVAYQPFSPSLPRLPEPSSLRLDGDLPVLDGALALYPVYSAFATAVYPEKSYALGSRFSRDYVTNDAYYDGKTVAEGATAHEVHFTNTIAGFRGLLDGRVDIYFMADVSDEQKAFAAQKGVELVYTPIGREAFVFFVNADNPVNSLTIEQIRGIYSGKITSWAQLGGKGGIKPFQRNKNSGSQSALERLMQGERIIDPPTNERPGGMGGIIRHVANYKNYAGAIGFSFRFFSTQMAADRQIKLLEIGGIAPVKENIANGGYPLSSYFYAITRKGNDKPNVRKMLEFMTSKQGQYLVEQVGYVPVGGASTAPHIQTATGAANVNSDPE